MESELKDRRTTFSAVPREFVMVLRVLLTGAVGGLLYLDRFQLFQTMASRPMVAAPLVGWVAGDLSAGLAAGLVFEMLWLRRPPVGGFVPPDATLASVATAAVAALVRQSTGTPVTATVCLSFLLLFPVSMMGVRLDVLVRLVLGNLARKVEAAQRNDLDVSFYPYLIAGLLVGFGSAFLVLSFLIFFSAFILMHVVPWLPASCIRAAGFAFYVVPLLGAADLMVRLDDVQDRVLFFVGFATAAATALLLAVH
jgi:PTS system mannose-specific IIC component